ncbi:radical SAM protein [Paenibacillus macerans]|uniref:Radical SAM additional 4Fe4S-binding SPASM domain protein n=1 Tax=Paenibacillus macerans TaxID=44252 RepID=A0A090ZIV9_PAEMA|nr:radical SAM protein [Paenibacillus macerans]KFN10180.1 radical SAM additional 4Fe4S-binding SPASM domain protein [Paenibacillus macerans]MCY7560966.1 radical SAM protein [Paenibacillus macerans]MEC0138082.1 radical SAM protein [Paenibacillus macerans]MEC0153616.1 radical SAM protein [Paenibacillus macerans]SUD26994.1 Ribosomal RNA large subunit methyltransferase N [Paenibacillus macerans]
MKYVFNPYLHELFHDQQAIIANTKTGNFLRTSKSYYHVLKELIDSEETGQLLNLTEDAPHSEVVQNLKKLFDALVNIECILTEDQLADIYRERLDVVYLALTNKCNLKCKHCSASADIRFTDALTTDKIKETIDRIVKLRPEAVNLTGGEPMMRVDFMEVLAYLRAKYDGAVLLATNGLFINEKNAGQLLKYIDHISFSVDGYDEETCAKIRGRGIFGRVIRNIHLLKSLGFKKISLSMTITNYTYDGGRERFLHLCEQLEVEPIVRTLTSEGRAGVNSEELFPSQPLAAKNVPKDLNCRLCSPGKRELFIGANGNIYPCGGLMESDHFILGNIFNNDLLELLTIGNSQVDFSPVDRARPWNLEPCKSCDVNLFCHHCISNIYYLRLNKPLFAAVCQQHKAELTQAIWKD